MIFFDLYVNRGTLSFRIVVHRRRTILITVIILLIFNPSYYIIQKYPRNRQLFFHFSPTNKLLYVLIFSNESLYLLVGNYTIPSNHSFGFLNRSVFVLFSPFLLALHSLGPFSENNCFFIHHPSYESRNTFQPWFFTNDSSLQTSKSQSNI